MTLVWLVLQYIFGGVLLLAAAMALTETIQLLYEAHVLARPLHPRYEKTHQKQGNLRETKDPSDRRQNVVKLVQGALTFICLALMAVGPNSGWLSWRCLVAYILWIAVIVMINDAAREAYAAYVLQNCHRIAEERVEKVLRHAARNDLDYNFNTRWKRAAVDLVSGVSAAVLGIWIF